MGGILECSRIRVGIDFRAIAFGGGMKKKIVLVGLHPDVVNYSLFPDGLHPRATDSELKAQEEGLQKLGFDVRMCFVDLGETAGRRSRGKRFWEKRSTPF